MTERELSLMAQKPIDMDWLTEDDKCQLLTFLTTDLHRNDQWREDTEKYYATDSNWLPKFGNWMTARCRTNYTVEGIQMYFRIVVHISTTASKDIAKDINRVEVFLIAENEMFTEKVFRVMDLSRDLYSLDQLARAFMSRLGRRELSLFEYACLETDSLKHDPILINLYGILFKSSIRQFFRNVQAPTTEKIKGFSFSDVFN